MSGFSLKEVYKWKNHFYEMKGDVGMSVHEKERKQEDAYTKTQTPQPQKLLLVCSTHFSFILVQSPKMFSLRSAHVDFMHAHAHAENLHVRTHT